MLATLVAAPFDNPDWQFEIKWDGFRVEAIVEGDDVRIWTRGEQDAGRYFGSFLAPPSWIAAREAIVDGEVIALDDRGEPDFALLQARIKGHGQIGMPTPFVYEVFDLLWLDGRSLLDEPLEIRRRLLAEALRPDPRVRLSEHVTGDGIAFFEAARVRGLEGSWPQHRGSLYVPGSIDGLAGRSDGWAGARRGRITRAMEAVELGARGWSACLPGLRAFCYACGVWAPGSTTGSAPSCWRLWSPSWWMRQRCSSCHRAQVIPKRAASGCARTSSSVPSSRAGPATGSCGRRPTRASTSARIHAQSGASSHGESR